MSQLIPSAVSLRIAETEQLYQAKRMIGGIGNLLLSTYSQTQKMGKILSFLLVNLSGASENCTWAFLGEQNWR